MASDFSKIGREGVFDDTKPTLKEAERNALINNEIEMGKDNLGFYNKIRQKADKLNEKLEKDFMKKSPLKGKSL